MILLRLIKEFYLKMLVETEKYFMENIPHFLLLGISTEEWSWVQSLHMYFCIFKVHATLFIGFF